MDRLISWIQMRENLESSAHSQVVVRLQMDHAAVSIYEAKVDL